MHFYISYSNLKVVERLNKLFETDHFIYIQYFACWEGYQQINSLLMLLRKDLTDFVGQKLNMVHSLKTVQTVTSARS